MVSVFFGVDRNAIINIDSEFEDLFVEDWLDDPVVKQMIKDIDKSTVLSKRCIQSPVLGQIPPADLSGGVKACILLYKCAEDVLLDLILCGENCQGWLSKIFKMKDVKVTMSGYTLPFRGYEIQGICENDSSTISNSRDWAEKMRYWVGEGCDR